LKKFQDQLDSGELKEGSKDHTKATKMVGFVKRDLGINAEALRKAEQAYDSVKVEKGKREAMAKAAVAAKAKENEFKETENLQHQLRADIERFTADIADA